MGINARAGTFTLTGVQNSSNIVYPTSGPDTSGIYVGPYIATVNGVANVQVICDDYNDSTTLGQSWNTNTTTFNSTGLAPNTTDVYFTSGRSSTGTTISQLQGYEEVAWLSEQLLNPTNSATTDANIQLAIWAIFGGGNVQTQFSGTSYFAANTTGNALWWMQQAESNTYTSGEFTNVQILSDTNTNTGRAQEFILVTPEPASALLLLIVFCALGGAMAYSRKPQTV